MIELNNLKNVRELLSTLKEKRDMILEEAKSDPIFKEIEILENEKLDLEFNIREEALKIYRETGEKKIGQIGIRVLSVLDYDEVTAFNWAKEHSLCLSLDKKNFEKLAKTQDIEFVKKSEKATATIPTKIEVSDDE